MPGDRTDDSIKSVSRICAEEFDRIYIKEDLDKRGRASGEVAKIFYDEILANQYDSREIEIILNELDALKDAVSKAKKDDLIVVFYENLEPLQVYLESYLC
jgi:cyanophycin synthetase